MPGAAEISPRPRGNISMAGMPMRHCRRRSVWLCAERRSPHRDRGAACRCRAVVGRPIVHGQLPFHLDIGSHRDLNRMDEASHVASARAKRPAAAVSIETVGGASTTTTVAITAMQTTAAYSTAAAVDGGAGGGIIGRALQENGSGQAALAAHGTDGSARDAGVHAVGGRSCGSGRKTKRFGSLRTPGHAVATSLR